MLKHGIEIIEEDPFEHLGHDKEEETFPQSIDYQQEAANEKARWLAYKQRFKQNTAKKSLGFAPTKLMSLSYDPLEAKVMLAEKYEAELKYHEALRDGRIINPSTGKPRSYSSQAHALVMVAYDRCINELMRYGYARVPEKDVDGADELPPISIELTLPSEEYDEVINNAASIIENTDNIRSSEDLRNEVKEEAMRRFKVPLKTFKGV